MSYTEEMFAAIEQEVKPLIAERDYYQRDAAAAWDTCELRRRQAEWYRQRAHMAETILLRALGPNHQDFQRYAAEYPMPVPSALPDVDVGSASIKTGNAVPQKGLEDGK